ncbi:hypothetical protein AXK11_02020 [Cephaloticoccus primus]|uniref:CAAX prenyl protease 2/Lysostaphin resistance protein A-like domain-containing protein n=1 Tax=Cephaloticoccus primus TaxID=1548207 RepID=A0A139SSN5_9BACT|nr:CPBP family intramembrane glutamic endopeptidase [Cephaloticoccus primus]KXU37595.1 hypothetical protein AXK11_02020 [Cephaloticoccus primus]
MSNNPLLLLTLTGFALYLAKLWWADVMRETKGHGAAGNAAAETAEAAGTAEQAACKSRAAQATRDAALAGSTRPTRRVQTDRGQGPPPPDTLPAPLPGASLAPPRALAVAALGSLALLAAETLGEYQLGIVGEQSTITALFALYTLAAAFIEELIFRGYLVVNGRGTAARTAGIVAASALFALLHPFLWQWQDAGFRLTLTLKGAFSTAVVFTASLWFYYLRFSRLNPRHSLLPCIVAHATKNLGVIAIKATQGFATDWY